MKTRHLISLFIALFISIDSYSQKAKMDDSFEFRWPQRYNIGLNLGYPHVAFVNLGLKFRDRVYIEWFFELASSEYSSNYIDLGIQANRLFDTKLKGQIGASFFVVPNEKEPEEIKMTKFGMNLKLTQPLSERFGLFFSSHITTPDENTSYSNLINFNIGIEFYLKNIPLYYVPNRNY